MDDPELPEREYLVSWSIDVSATSAKHAAGLAWAIMHDPASIASWLEVRPHEGGDVWMIDMDPDSL